jgi:hypothetical protein
MTSTFKPLTSESKAFYFAKSFFHIVVVVKVEWVYKDKNIFKVDIVMEHILVVYRVLIGSCFPKLY